jgi:hypothetical protein
MSKFDFTFDLEDRLTTEMQQVVTDWKNQLQEEANLCIRQIINAEGAGNISLPATAANGLPVVHGTRLIMNAMSTYWVARLNAIEQVIGMTLFKELTGHSGGTVGVVRMARAAKAKPIV